MKTGPLLPK